MGRSLRALPALAGLVIFSLFGSTGTVAAAESRPANEAPPIQTASIRATLPAVADAPEDAPEGQVSDANAADEVSRADPRDCAPSFEPDSAGKPHLSTTEQLSCTARQIDRDRNDGKVAPSHAQPNALSQQLSGSVRNTNGVAIPDVYVDLITSSGDFYDEVQTDSSGHWTADAEAGTYYLEFTDGSFTYARGWYDHSYPYYPSTTANFSASGANASRVVVTGADIGGLDIAMPATTPLAGRVMAPPPNNQSGQSGYAVEFFIQGFYYGWVETEDDGTYEAALAPGAYEIYFTDEQSPGLWYKTGSSAYVIDDATEVTVPSSSQYGITLRQQSTLRFTVGSGAANNADVWVEFCGGPDDLCTADNPGNAGDVTYSIWPGDYVLRVRDANGRYASGYWNGSVLQTDPSLAASIHVDQASGAHVTVPATATCTIVQPLTNAPDAVYVVTYAHDVYQNEVLYRLSVGQVEVKVNCGAAYRVWYYDPDELRASGWYSSGGLVYDYDSATDVSSTGTVTLPSLDLPAALHLKGTVTGADGLPIAGACVAAWQGSDTPFYDYADATGAYDTAISPGTYKVSFNLDRASVCAENDPGWATHGSYLSGGPYAQGWYGASGFVFDADSASAANVVVDDSDVTLNMVLPTVPSVPRSVAAFAGEGLATLSWAAPASNNGSAVTSYVVSSSPAGGNCAVATTLCTITGLLGGTEYTFTVAALNRVGRGLPSAGQSVTVLVQSATFHPMDPVRVLDTRAHNGLSAKLKANTPVTFQVTGRSDVSPQIPAGASAVTGNVTVVNSTAAWAVYLGPSPIAKPSSSTINFTAGQIVANGVTVALGSGGNLSATYMGPAGATTDLVFDVTGYFTPDATGATFHPIEPARDLDTRANNGLSGKIKANVPATFQVAGRNGVPSNAAAVTGNVTAVNSSAPWAVYLGPKPIGKPGSSTVNFTAGAVVANNVTVALGSGGNLSATYMGPAGATTDLVFDVTGYYTADATGSSFVPLEPARLLDTRSGNGLSGKFQAGVPQSFTVATRGGVPANANGVTGNVTIVNQTYAWAVFVGPNPIASPSTSTLNFIKGDIKANGMTVALSATGTLSATYLSSKGNTTDLVFDVTGYFVNYSNSGGLAIAPSTATIQAGAGQTFVSVLDGALVTGSTTFSIVAGPGGVKKGATTYQAGSTVPGATCTASSCTATIAGVYSITGTKGTAKSQIATLTVNAAAATALSVTGLATSTAPGTVDNGMVVTAFDRYGNVATGFRDLVAFVSSDPLAIVPERYQFTASDAGVHHFTAPNGVSFRTPGTQSVTAIDPVASSMIWGAQTGISVSGTGTSSTYHPLSPVRLLDTRTGNGLVGRMTAGTPRTLQVAGQGGVPANAVAVTGAFTAVSATAAGYLYAGPTEVSSPGISVLGVVVGRNKANGLGYPLSGTGTLSITYSASAGNTTDAIFDVSGYFTADSTGAIYHSVNPAVALDTRTGSPLFANTPQTFALAGTYGVPESATAVSGIVVVPAPEAAWALYVGPVATAAPTSSVVSFDAGQTESNGFTTALSGTGSLSATYMGLAGATTDLVFVVTGYYAP